MSGGFFEYKQHCISNIIDDMEKLLLSGNFPFEIEGEIKDCISLLRKSYVYVQRIDWFLSDNDGYETFIVRLKEDLAKVKQLETVCEK